MTSGKNNLENLARAGQLAAEPTSADEIGRLLKGARDQLRDSRNISLSAPSRFILAYGSSHALAALRAEGYRPSASKGRRNPVRPVRKRVAGRPARLAQAAAVRLAVHRR